LIDPLIGQSVPLMPAPAPAPLILWFRLDLRLADRLVIRTSPVANEMIRLPEENT